MIKQENTRKILTLANLEKEKTRCLLRELKEELKQVLACNKLLPEPVQFSDDYFQLDERINNSIIEGEQSKMNKLRLKLAFNYEKSLLARNNVKNYFVDNILTNKFKVKAILTDIGVTTIYHKTEYNNIFISLVNEFLSKKRPKRRREMTVLSKSAPQNMQAVSESELFLRNVRQKYSSFPKKIQFAIDKFAARRDFENRVLLNIEKMNKNKPGDKNNIEEEALLENTLDSIGYLNIKSGSNYKMMEDKIIIMEDTFEQYMEVKEKVYNLKTTFNEKVCELRTRKIKLIHEYIQFKFDVNIIQKELNDPEIITPLDFPQVLIDESIDPSLIDSFEPIDHLDPMDLFFNPEKSPLYKNAYSYEEPTHQEIVMKKMIIDKLKYKHMHLHETMLKKIDMFDDQLFKLNKMRIEVKLEIKFLDLWATTLEEEMLVLYDFDLLEDELSYNVHVKTGLQNDKAQQIQRIQEDINYYSDINIKKTNMLIDNQNTFDMCMKMENKGFAKHLKKIFDKKLKIPKIKTDYDDDVLSSSSSDGSDESEQDFNSESGESLMAMSRAPAVFDEKVLPLGCDPKLFNTTLELRSKKYEIEQIIGTNKKKLEISNAQLIITFDELDVIENELKEIQNELEECRIKKQLKLNDIYTTIVLNKSQISKAKSLKTSILLYGNVLQDLSKRTVELKREEKDIIKTLKKEKLCAKKDRIEIAKMENVLKNIKTAIKDEMVKKFKTEMDWKFLDQMEMTIIDYMIINSKTDARDTKKRFIHELKILENKIFSQQNIVTDLLKSNTLKNKILKNVLGNFSKIRQYLDTDQEKIMKKSEDLSTETSCNAEITAMNCKYDKLLKHKQDICEQINFYKFIVSPPTEQQSKSEEIQSLAINDKITVTPITGQKDKEELDLDTITKRFLLLLSI
ncbi:unnamed protein product [Aphis gossypii]|uniref:Uncharacterized protein n=1 Tax=Aphis gossypii TaxID=80765 RepID=A0A9P0NKX5_APHGO|nr:unnamed protein product [Aphis gossypii]